MIIIKDSMYVTYSTTLKALIHVGSGSEGVLKVQSETTHIVAGACASRVGVTDIRFEGKKVVLIDEEAFTGCEGLTQVVLPDSIREIADGAFLCCSNLESITLPRKLKMLAPSVLCCCNLKSIEIPQSVTKIGAYALASNDELSSVHIPASVREIAHNAFDCDKLQKITVDPSNAYYSSVDGVLYDKEMTRLVSFPANWPGKEFRIPDSVTSLERSAFCRAKIERVYIPRGIQKIPYQAFAGCKSLCDVSGMAGVREMCKTAFTGSPLREEIQSVFNRE